MLLITISKVSNKKSGVHFFTLLRGLISGGGRMVETLCPDSTESNRTELSSPTAITRGVFFVLQWRTGRMLLTGTRV